MQAKLLCAQKIAHAKSLLKFIRTEAAPPILWQPADLNDDLERLYIVRPPFSPDLPFANPRIVLPPPFLVLLQYQVAPPVSWSVHSL